MGQQLAEDSRDVHRGTGACIGENGQESFQAGLGFHGAAQDERAISADTEHGIHRGRMSDGFLPIVGAGQQLTDGSKDIVDIRFVEQQFDRSTSIASEIIDEVLQGMAKMAADRLGSTRIRLLLIGYESNEVVPALEMKLDRIGLIICLSHGNRVCEDGKPGVATADDDETVPRVLLSVRRAHQPARRRRKGGE